MVETWETSCSVGMKRTMLQMNLELGTSHCLICKCV